MGYYKEIVQMAPEIEARQVTQDNLSEIADWTGGHVVDDHIGGIQGSLGRMVYLDAHPGQWIAKRHPDGLHFVRDDSWWREHYEEVEAVTPA